MDPLKQAARWGPGAAAIPTTLNRVSELQDPERMLAEALRAQARSAPTGAQPAQQSTSTPAPTGLPPQYGLLSGSDGGVLARESAALEPPTVRHAPVQGKTAGGPIPVYWILLLAVLLGLATGAVIGLITLL